MKRLLALVLSLMVVFTMASCGGSGGEDKSDKEEVKKSKTYELLKDLSQEKGLSMDFDLTFQGLTGNMVLISKEGNFYSKVTHASSSSVFIFDGEYYYMLNTVTMQGVKSSEPIGPEPEDYESFFYGISDFEEPTETGKMEIEGETYQCETYMTAEDEGTKFCFDGDRLAYIIGIKGEDEMVMKINSFEKKADDSMFKVPSGYTIKEA